MRIERRSFLAMTAAVPLAMVLGGCGGGSTDDGGVRLVSADAAADLVSSGGSDELVILDIRTPEEFDGGHLEDAVLLDFYRDDFRDQLAELDPDASYLMYCRSGNRSGQARAMMQELGFSDVRDLDGGVIAWVEAGHPTVQG